MPSALPWPSAQPAWQWMLSLSQKGSLRSWGLTWPVCLYPEIEDEEEKVSKYRELLARLPPVNRATVKALISHLYW